MGELEVADAHHFLRGERKRGERCGGRGGEHGKAATRETEAFEQGASPGWPGSAAGANGPVPFAERMPAMQEALTFV
ncbi:hypothetical protein MEX01_41600 [Methylorubrum extorquens]|nr:hypothetical protein MEX01_41600 [Methylorubrum extorquens]